MRLAGYDQTECSGILPLSAEASSGGLPGRSPRPRRQPKSSPILWDQRTCCRTGTGFPPDRLPRPLRAARARIDHRSSQFLRQQPGGLIRDGQLCRELQRRHAIGVGCHEVRSPEPYGQGQLRAVHYRTRGHRRLAPAAEAFVGVRPALQQDRTPGAASGADEALRPAPLEQEGCAARLVRKARLEFVQRSRPNHSKLPLRRPRRAGPILLHIVSPGSTG